MNYLMCDVHVSKTSELITQIYNLKKLLKVLIPSSNYF